MDIGNAKLRDNLQRVERYTQHYSLWHLHSVVCVCVCRFHQQLVSVVDRGKRDMETESKSTSHSRKRQTTQESRGPSPPLLPEVEGGTEDIATLFSH